LVEGWKNVISKLNFGDSSSSHCSITDGKTGNTLLAQGRIENPIIPEFFFQINSAAKNASESYILSEDDLKGRRENKRVYGKRKKEKNGAESLKKSCVFSTPRTVTADLSLAIAIRMASLTACLFGRE
jgi:hypothetical protein